MGKDNAAIVEFQDISSGVKTLLDKAPLTQDKFLMGNGQWLATFPNCLFPRNSQIP